MPKIELNRPVRLRVDLAAPPGIPHSFEIGNCWLDPVRAERGIDAVVESGIFFLELGYPAPEGKHEKVLLDFIKRASSRGIIVSVILGKGGVPFDGLLGAGAREVALDLTGVAGGQGAIRGQLEAFQRQRGKISQEALKTGALFQLRRDTVSSLGDLLAACGGSSIDFLELPPLPLVYYSPDDAAGVLIGPEGYGLIREVLKKSVVSLEGIGDLRVHDILISAMLDNLYDVSRKGRTFSGCQAAAALGYVGPDGTVFPCASLGFPLGDVEDLKEMDFWELAKAADIREKAARMTPKCRQCRVLDICHGGCPGLRVAACGSWDGDDPLCVLFRKLTAESR